MKTFVVVVLGIMVSACASTKTQQQSYRTSQFCVMHDETFKLGVCDIGVAKLLCVNGACSNLPVPAEEKKPATPVPTPTPEVKSGKSK